MFIWLMFSILPAKNNPKHHQQFLAAMEQLKEKVGEEKYNDFLLSHKITETGKCD